VGELLEERDAGRAREVVERQLRVALQGVTDADGLVVAYEPVWAIGTGRAATARDAAEMMEHIRSLLVGQMGRSGETVPLLYGGSVTAANIGEFVSQVPIDGALVGGASLKPAEFVEIVRQTAEARAGR
jgi:triosephosphate isomerase